MFFEDVVQSPSDLVQIVLLEFGQVASFGKVLPQQPVGVLVGSSLPRTARVAEVHLHVGGNAESLVSSHLGATVPSQRAT